ncbi:MAG: hypothetical protein HPPSJP_4090 [Candidatus Hepatoplasma scabrum]|nr:MAG: hypothetical protein HPPSJP_4090 [Candidatus Hepatoplasma sp.]
MNNKEEIIEKTIQTAKKFRILSIDGGGVKGYFTIYTLKKLMDEYKINLYDYFDMIVGTSTGAILALLILLKLDLEKYCREYEEIPNRIFSKRLDILSQTRKPFFPQFDGEELKKSLIEELGDLNFDDFEAKVKKYFVFCASNVSNGKPVMFASKNFKSVNQKHRKELVRNAIYASSAAPFYFEPIKSSFTNDYFADGGLWANNPSMVGIILALADLNLNLEDIEVLSFGQTYIENLEFEIKKIINFDNFRNNQFSSLFSSSLLVNQNFDNFCASILLKEHYYRYYPEQNIPNIKVSSIDKNFINYTKVYWKENKESLVKFIKFGENAKYYKGVEKMYN